MMIDPNQPAFPFEDSLNNIFPGLTVRAELASRYIAASLFNADTFTEEEGRSAIKAMIWLADETIRQLNEDEEQERANRQEPPAYDEFKHGMSQGH